MLVVCASAVESCSEVADEAHRDGARLDQAGADEHRLEVVERGAVGQVGHLHLHRPGLAAAGVRQVDPDRRDRRWCGAARAAWSRARSTYGSRSQKSGSAATSTGSDGFETRPLS